MRRGLKRLHSGAIVLILLFLFVSCSNNYDIRIEKTNKVNAPKLQSFVHAYSGDDWLLFAGRTNRDSLIGGLHNINGNYANTSFVPLSYNKTLFVYNVGNDKVISQIKVSDLGSHIQNVYNSIGNKPVSETFISSLIDSINNNSAIFVNSNPLVTQDDEGYLYVLGGYGAKQKDVNKKIKYYWNNYITYNQIAKIHINSMINLLNGNGSDVEWNKLIRFGKNEKLICTGGELFKIGNTFYMAGGQNFNLNYPYVNGVYPFTLKNNGELGLSISVDDLITDLPTEISNRKYMDSLSIFRRRDLPVVPSLTRNEGKIEQGLTFYTGVFKYKKKHVKHLEAWNDAIYVHPSWGNKKYTYDSLYNQNNHNVYACADLEAFDENTGQLHTFLMGGIGTGIGRGKDTLSGFTNNSVHIRMNVDTLRSRFTLKYNTFNSDTLFGAESVFIPNQSALYYTDSNGSSTEVLDLKTMFPDYTGSKAVGYIYGGIEAYEVNPQSYGRGKSAASGRIWKVVLSKE